jgi:tRNA(Ile)-lysidine synthase
LGLELGRELTGRFIVAFSGGIDSHVLLHLVATVLGAGKDRLLAIHVDHGLNEESAQWSRHCLSVASGLGIDATVLRVDAGLPRGESLESWARRHRYRLLKTVMMPDDIVMTAHHREDLAETLLLQLLRGAGPHGLASIPERQSFGPGFLLRPLLNVSRAALEGYAAANGLRWVEDPTNATDRHDRNYVRHRVLPVIEERWPAVTARIAHAVALQQEAAACLDSVADEILDRSISTDGARLPVAAFSAKSGEMARWVLRRWIVRAGFPIPDAVHLREMGQIFRARQDRQPCVTWKGAEMRRYRDRLYLLWSRKPPDKEREYSWDLRSPLKLPTGVLSAETSMALGLRATLAAENEIVVRFRGGGERCHPVGRSHSQSLKRLFQEWGVPTWQRAEVPLVMVGAEVAAVAGLCVSREFVSPPGEPGWTLHWLPNEIQ